MYFPYLHMQTVGEVNFQPLGLKIWNFGEKVDDYITDLSIKETLTKLMKSNIAHNLPISDMGIVTIGNSDFRPFTKAELLKCNEARLLLFIGATSRFSVQDRSHNKGHFVYTSDNFILQIQNFNLGGNTIAVQTGIIVPKLIGGYGVDEIKFEMPLFTPTPMRWSQDTLLINALLKLRSSNKKMYRRLLRAIELVMQASYNNETTSMNARILLLASAFEILFDITDNKHREHFKSAIRTYLVQPADRKLRFTSWRNSTRFVWETDSIKVMWADKFYYLRNKIVHGETISNHDLLFLNRQNHYDIAILFFVLGLKKVLNTESGEPPARDYIEWTKNNSDDPAEFFEGFCYRELDDIMALIKN